MHEMSIVINLLDIIKKNAQENNLEKVSNVKIVVGELSGVVPEILKFNWQIAAEGSICEEAELEIEKIPAQAICKNCLKEYNFTKSLSCPYCGGGVKEVLSGKELYVDYIEGE